MYKPVTQRFAEEETRRGGINYSARVVKSGTRGGKEGGEPPSQRPRKRSAAQLLLSKAARKNAELPLATAGSTQFHLRARTSQRLPSRSPCETRRREVRRWESGGGGRTPGPGDNPTGHRLQASAASPAKHPRRGRGQPGRDLAALRRRADQTGGLWVAEGVSRTLQKPRAACPIWRRGEEGQ